MHFPCSRTFGDWLKPLFVGLAIFRLLDFEVWLSHFALWDADLLTNLIDSSFDLDCQMT
jgi:hypothetical protein